MTDGVGATVVSPAGLVSDRERSDCPTGIPAAMTTTAATAEHARALAALVLPALNELAQQVGGGRADQVGVAVQGGAQVEVVHRAPSGVRVVVAGWSSSSRRRVSPRDAWLFTEPTEQPSASAVSASNRPS